MPRHNTTVATLSVSMLVTPRQDGDRVAALRSHAGGWNGSTSDNHVPAAFVVSQPVSVYHGQSVTQPLASPSWTTRIVTRKTVLGRRGVVQPLVTERRRPPLRRTTISSRTITNQIVHPAKTVSAHRAPNRRAAAPFSVNHDAMRCRDRPFRWIGLAGGRTKIT